MVRLWLVLDVPNLCFRNFYAKNGESYSLKDVAFGIKRDLDNLESTFSSNCFVFCFDSQKSLRKEISPSYRAKRDVVLMHNNPDNVEFSKRKMGMKQSISRLRDGVLQEIGYRNVFHQEGFEADDAIASVCHNLSNNESAVIVSEDQDFFQLLAPDVKQYLPRVKEIITEQGFKERFWGCFPEEWPQVKAIAGCDSDSVTGLYGIGERKAVNFLQGQMSQKTDSYMKCMKWIQSSQYEMNLKLVRLPLEGTPIFKAKVHAAISEDAWDKVVFGGPKRSGE